MRSIKRHWPLIVAAIVLWSTIAVLLLSSVTQNHRHLVYALDDPYIHMAIAKNFSQHGVWGATKYEFGSLSSSPLWTLILSSVYFLFGVDEVSPLVLNLVFATLLLTLSYILLRRSGLTPSALFLVLLLMLFATPLPAITLCGQEHILHALLALLFVHLSAKTLSTERPASSGFITLLILAPLVTMVRYEGLFLLFVVSVLFVMRRRVFHSLSLGAIGVLPLCAYGILSVLNGSYFLPNPVLLKGNLPDVSGLEETIKNLAHFVYQAVRAPHMLVLLSVVLILFLHSYKRQRQIWSYPTIMNTIFIVTTVLHMQFAGIGWFYRYEAYLLALGFFVIVRVGSDYLPAKRSVAFDRILWPSHAAAALLVLLLVSPLAERAVVSLIRVPRATTNIYQQQYQMGLFLRDYYEGEAVAVNDIGAVNFVADIRCLDLWGLASIEVARLRLRNGYTQEMMRELVREKGVKIAILYDSWYGEYGGVPSEWVRVGQWQIPNSVLVDSLVSFYAVDRLERDELVENLRSCSSQLPKEIVQSGEYTR